MPGVPPVPAEVGVTSQAINHYQGATGGNAEVTALVRGVNRGKGVGPVIEAKK